MNPALKDSLWNTSSATWLVFLYATIRAVKTIFLKIEPERAWVLVVWSCTSITWCECRVSTKDEAKKILSDYKYSTTHNMHQRKQCIFQGYGEIFLFNYLDIYE